MKKQYIVSCGPSGWIFLTVSLTVCFIPWMPLFRVEPCWVEILVFFYLCGCGFLTLALIYGTSFVLNEDGITHRLFGIKCRFTPWTECQDAAIVKSGGRSGAIGVLFTCNGGLVCRPRGHTNKYGVTDNTVGDLCIQNRGLFKSLLKGKNFYMLVSYTKQSEKIIDYVRNCGERTGRFSVWSSE